MAWSTLPLTRCYVCHAEAPDGLAVTAHVVGEVVGYICADCRPWGERGGLLTSFVLAMRARYPDVDFQYYPLKPSAYWTGLPDRMATPHAIKSYDGGD